MTHHPLSYSHDEIVGNLPTGWMVSDPIPTGIWDPQKARWTLVVADGADVEWRLDVDDAQAARHGRVEALRRAIDHLYRCALG